MSDFRRTQNLKFIMSQYYSNKDSRRFRDTSKFLPPGLPGFDYLRMAEIDKFYMDCQRYRDFYKGRIGKEHPVPGFHRAGAVYDRTVNPTVAYLRYPMTMATLDLTAGQMGVTAKQDFRKRRPNLGDVIDTAANDGA